MEAAASSLRFSARRTAQSVFCVVGRNGLLSITEGAGPAGVQQVAWAGRSSRQDLGKGTRPLPPWPSWALVRSKELCASPGPFLDHLTHFGGWPSSQGSRWVLLQPNLGAVRVAGTRERQVRCPGTQYVPRKCQPLAASSWAWEWRTQIALSNLPGGHQLQHPGKSTSKAQDPSLPEQPRQPAS